MRLVEQLGEVLPAAKVGMRAKLRQDDAIRGLNHRGAGPPIYLQHFVVVNARIVLWHG